MREPCEGSKNLRKALLYSYLCRKGCTLKTLVLGLGNPILTDDGVGIHIVRALAGRLDQSDVEVAEASLGGLRLLDTAVGYNRLILVDAIQAGGPIGQVYRLGPNDMPSSLHAASSHDLSLAAALELGRRIGLVLPGDEAITIVAVEVEDVFTFGEQCTPAVAAAIPHAVEAVLAEVEQNTFLRYTGCSRTTLATSW